MFETSHIISSVEAMKDEIIANRRYLHEHPEISGQEYETSKYIQGKMKELGLEPVMCHPIAFYCIIDSGKPGKTVALRADIDALAMPESENNLKQKKVCVSKVEGVTHACGHDGHIAMLIGSAKYLVENKDKFSGRVMLMFESAEEAPPNSYHDLVEAMKKEKVDAVWGMHLYAMMPVGTISVDAGPRMAGCARFGITINGRGGHGSRPDQSISPIITMAEIVAKMQSLILLNVAPDEPCSMSVCSIKGGEAWNIIPDTCTITGSLRYFSDEQFHAVMGAFKDTIEGICKANKCTADLYDWPQPLYCVINDANLSDLAAKSVDTVLPGARKKESPWMASESFGAYQMLVPGVFAFVGIADEEMGAGAAHHNVRFDMNEDALLVGCKATLQFVSDYLA